MGDAGLGYVMVVAMVLIAVGVVRGLGAKRGGAGDTTRPTTRGAPARRVAPTQAERAADPAQVTAEPAKSRAGRETGIAPPKPAPSPPSPLVAPGRVNPDASFPITLSDTSPPVIAAVRHILSDRESDVDGRASRLQEHMLRGNWHCVELDAFLDDLRTQVERRLDAKRRSSAEWEHAAPADRLDLEHEWIEDIWEKLPTRICSYFDEYREALLAPPPADLTVDDPLLERYPLPLLQFYLNGPGDKNGVVSIPAERSTYRAYAEALVARGLMRRGGDIPLADLLGQLTIADMRKLVADLSPPKWSRRAQALAYLQEVPDLSTRLGALLPVRAQFQRLPLPEEFSSLDLAALRQSWAQAYAKCLLLIWAYSASDNHQQLLASPRGTEFWADVYEPCCPTAKRLEERGEPLTRRNIPRVLPPHFGCCVRIEGA